MRVLYILLRIFNWATVFKARAVCRFCKCQMNKRSLNALCTYCFREKLYIDVFIIINFALMNEEGTLMQKNWCLKVT